jgi:2-C-methyl-D-erythritol 2,4-cyclodiphosphate synthase
MLREKGLRIVNIDTVLIAEEPRISPYRDKIVKNLSRITGLKEEAISVKAKTKEGLGFIGRKEGIEAYAVVLVEGDRSLDG